MLALAWPAVVGLAAELEIDRDSVVNKAWSLYKSALAAPALLSTLTLRFLPSADHKQVTSTILAVPVSGFLAVSCRYGLSVCGFRPFASLL